MRSEILQDALGAIRDEYIMDANIAIKSRRGSNIRFRRCLIAALVALFAFSTAYALHISRLQDLVVADNGQEAEGAREEMNAGTEKNMSVKKCCR